MKKAINITACIVSTGRELVSGRSQDTNWRWLLERLQNRGIAIISRFVIDDNHEALVAAIRCGAEISDIVLVTGGLGPTHDDITRLAMAAATGTKLVTDKKSLDRINLFFKNRGEKTAKSNKIQAMIPSTAKAIPNRIGTAPGMDVQLGNARIFALPGVPAEMKAMFQEYVCNLLPEDENAEHIRILGVTGKGESEVADKLADLLDRESDVWTGITASDGLITVRIGTTGQATAGKEKTDRMIKEIRKRLGASIIGEEPDTMEAVVGELLRKSGQTVSTAESCTGGMAGYMLTSVPGSSEYYIGGVVAYSDRLKNLVANVSSDTIAGHGAVSEPAAKEMAEGIRDLTGSDWGLSITGIAGPSGGSAEKPVGLVYTSLAGPDGTSVTRHFFSGDRNAIRMRAAVAAIDSLRLKLLKENDSP